LHPGEKRLIAFASSECPRLPVNMAADLNGILESAATANLDIVNQLNTLLDRLDHLLELERLNPRLWM
jgi:hypothetical protein